MIVIILSVLLLIIVLLPWVLCLASIFGIKSILEEGTRNE